MKKILSVALVLALALCCLSSIALAKTFGSAFNRKKFSRI